MNGMLESVPAFYDQLANDYHLIYGKWEQAMTRQCDALHGVIQANTPGNPSSMNILDCSCGIGTQAIGLALLGYKVHGTDVSPKAVARAKSEAARLGASLTFGVSDYRDLVTYVDGVFDIVLSCDNALSHAVGEGDLKRALDAMSTKVREGGLLLLSIDDYDEMIKTRPSVSNVRRTKGPSGTCYVFRAREWSDDDQTYVMDHFIVHETSDGWQTAHGRTMSRAVLRKDLQELATEVGLDTAIWSSPKATGYFQQIMTARKRQRGET